MQKILNNILATRLQERVIFNEKVGLTQEGKVGLTLENQCNPMLTDEIENHTINSIMHLTKSNLYF